MGGGSREERGMKVGCNRTKKEWKKKGMNGGSWGGNEGGFETRGRGPLQCLKTPPVVNEPP